MARTVTNQNSYVSITSRQLLLFKRLHAWNKNWFVLLQQSSGRENIQKEQQKQIENRLTNSNRQDRQQVMVKIRNSE